MFFHVLAIETSCDDTAVAVYDIFYKRIRSSIRYSQIEEHKEYGGVVPELASRAHLEKLPLLVDRAIEQANISKEDICMVGVTNGPGLAGSLLVGLSFAKAFAASFDIPVVPVDHIYGHLFSSFLDKDGQRTEFPFPHCALLASGGHTGLYSVDDYDSITPLVETRDDAAGEAFDKIGKMIGLSYPAGATIEKLARENDFKDVYKFPRTRIKKEDPFFSFSGLKTAVFYHLLKEGLVTKKCKPTDKITPQIQRDIASSLLVCVADILCSMTDLVLQNDEFYKGLSFVGGVSHNRYIGDRLREVAEKNNRAFVQAAQPFATDNAAMIALYAHYLFENEDYDLRYDADIFV